MSLAKNLLKIALRTDEERHRELACFVRLLGRAGAGGKLLDVGCAGGYDTLRYAQALSVSEQDIWGIEGQAPHAEAARKRFKVEVLDLEKEPFPFADENFDIVTCNQTLEHLKNIFLPLSEMERVLKTGGHLALGVPNLAGLHNRLLLAAGRQPVCNHVLGPHIRCFTHSALREFLGSNPSFELTAVSGSSLYPLPYPLLELGARLLPGLAAYTFYLLRKVAHATAASPWRVTSIGDTLL